MASTDIILPSGKRIPQLPLSAKHIIDRTTVLYGASHSGKTYIVKHMMATVDEMIDEVIAIAPSEPTNRSYRGIVPSPLIHYRLWLPDPKAPQRDDGQKGAIRFMEWLWKRQEMRASIYTRVNNPEVLAKLYGRIPKTAPERREGDQTLAMHTQKRHRVLDRLKKAFGKNSGQLHDKREEVEEKFERMLVLIYKKYITPHFGDLLGSKGLTEDERYTLHYLHFNPRILLIFDDCAAQLKPLFTRDVFRLLFYQGRHSFCTSFFCCQDDTDLALNLRKNAFVSVYTDPVVSTSYFERAKTTKETKKYVTELVPEVFGKKHRKFVYIREDDRQQHFYHFTAPNRKPPRFGSDALWELCEMVGSRGIAMDTNNPFYNMYKV